MEAYILYSILNSQKGHAPDGDSLWLLGETVLLEWLPYPSSVSLMMSHISMLSAQSSDCRELLVARSVNRKALR